MFGKFFSFPPTLHTYHADGRRPLEDLYSAYSTLVETHGWMMETIYTQENNLPIIVFSTQKKGPAFWIIAGIHGEEPAGPNAIAENISLIAELGKKIPVLLLPMCNPSGYMRDWRYPNERRDWRLGRSVSDSEYFLLSKENPFLPRKKEVASKEAFALTSKILERVKTHPPLITIDHHEDEALHEAYIYSQGKMGAHDPVAQKTIEILLDSEIPVQMSGTTRFGEEIVNGIIGPVSDGSVDELLSSEKIIVNGHVVPGPSSHTSLVIETPTQHTPLKKRIAAHANIILAYEEFSQVLLSNSPTV